MPVLETELNIVCLDEERGIAKSLTDRYQDTNVYLADPEHFTVSKSKIGGEVNLTGLRSLAEPSDATYELNPDVVLLVLRTGVRGSVAHLAAKYSRTYRKLIKHEPDLPVLTIMPSFVRKTQDSDFLERVLKIASSPTSDYVFSCDDIDMEEVHFRLRKLFFARERGLHQTSAGAKRSADRPQPHEEDLKAVSAIADNFVPGLRDEKTGRLDAKRVSRMFGLTVTELAEIIQRDKSSVAKTPTAPRLQDGLRVFERIASMLLFLVEDPQQLRMWMNAPNTEFRGKPPIDYVKEGLGELVAQRLENALSGQPA